jgi:hypothetical protein
MILKKPLIYEWLFCGIVLKVYNQLPLDPPVLMGFLFAPVDFVFAFAINFELPPCTVDLALFAVFFAAFFSLI